MAIKSKYFVLFILFLATQNIYSQYLPDWLKMGMTKEDIEKNINTQLYNRKDNLYIYANLDASIIYQFKIGQNGVSDYWIIGKYLNIKTIVEDFDDIYGNSIYIEDIYWWTVKPLLPLNVKAIMAHNKNNNVNICYFYNNSLE